MKNKIVIIAPHLSTGGLPAFVIHKIKEYQEMHWAVAVVEWKSISHTYITHRKIVQDLVGENYLLANGDENALINFINEFEAFIIRIEELNFLPESVSDYLYDSGRFRIFEATHNVNAIPDKKYASYCLPSQFLVDRFTQYGVDARLDEMVLETKDPNKPAAQKLLNFDTKKKHVLCVGLVNEYKNQLELVQIAKDLHSYMPSAPVHFHFVGTLAENFRSYWEPILEDLPPNCKFYGERNDVDLFYQACDCMYFPSTYELNPLVIKEAVAWKLPTLTRYLNPYGPNITQDPLVQELTDNVPENAAKLMSVLEIEIPAFVIDYNYGCTFRSNPFNEAEYDVSFRADNEIIYETKVGRNSWAKPSILYRKNWEVIVNGESHKMDLNGKSVRVTVDTKSLGDTLAYVPQAVVFAMTTGINKLYISTYHNELLDYEVNPVIQFISPEDNVDTYATYKLGYYFHEYAGKAPRDQRDLALGEVASDILSMQYSELRPWIKYDMKQKRKKVAICSESTAAAKQWQNPMGWHTVATELTKAGFEVVHIGHKESSIVNTRSVYGQSLPTIVKELEDVLFFVGLPSGLSWLAWSMEIPVVMIAGFSESFAEFTKGCYRVTNPVGCQAKCWNNKNFVFDKNDWNWCPVFKNYPDQFSCTKNISPELVKIEINRLMLDIYKKYGNSKQQSRTMEIDS
jgi:glycosyltransferase involved in cell wall biosynthesis